MNKTLLINVALTFTYFFVSAMALAPDKVTSAIVLSAVASGVRGAIGVVMEARGKTLPMDR